ncbi:SOS response-associated peptidase [uncultured Sneathiella sp.]|uniref:SOS response-associated peptidase n=1 Tax=uncultured Sneathiella sp. TaxID=879315 RepID=UPI0025988A3A|nr:SOS response-associated peptidase [uncultured Sneathiella sp.]
MARSMCGRFSLTSPVEAMRRVFDFPERPNLAARYNIAPTTNIAAIRVDKNATGESRHYFSAHWGLIPSWAKSTEFSAKMINARSETVTEKPAFRAAFKSRRCLIPANGFYEWQKLSKGAKQPWMIGIEDMPLFAFAGLWESWKSADGEVIESCTILTTTASKSIAFIHPRMPVILEPSRFDPWLRGEAGTEVLKAFDADRMTFYKVSSRVGNVRNDDADLLKPVDPPPTQARLL